MPILDNFESDYINDASESENGLMSALDKVKLDNIRLEDISSLSSGLADIEEYNTPRFVYGIKIDPNNSNPNTAVTYTDDAVGFIPLSINTSNGSCNYGSWKSIIENVLGVKPCLVKNDGTVLTYLDPNNYNRTINGNLIDIESGLYGQVMVKFNHIYYKFSVDGTKLWFQISNKQIDSTWVDTAFASEDGIGTVRKEMFIAAYESCQENNTLQSLSGKTPAFNLSFDTINETSSFGVFHMMNIAKKQFIIFLTYLVTKSIDLKTTIGNGNTRGGDILKTGTLDSCGLFYGKSADWQAVKVFGIENLWGNQLEYMNGIIQKLVYTFDDNGNYVDEQHLFVKNFYPYDNIDNFTDLGKIDPNQSGYISTIKFLTDSLYFPDKLKGSSTTYFKSYYENGKSVDANDRLYGIYSGNNKYDIKDGPEFLLLGNPDYKTTQITTHIVY